MHQHQAVLQFLPRFLRNLVAGEDMVPRQQAAAADSELRIAGSGLDSLDQFHAGPHAVIGVRAVNLFA